MNQEFELLYFRHSIAEDHHSDGDRFRRLTERGISEMKRAAATLRRLGLGWDRALTSPYVRAKETHAIVAEELGAPSEVEEFDLLIPAADGRDLRDALLAYGREHGGRVAAFGHNPSITSAVSHLLGGEGRAAYLNIAPGDAVRMRMMTGLQGQLPDAILLGFYPRAQMAKLGGDS